MSTNRAWAWAFGTVSLLALAAGAGWLLYGQVTLRTVPPLVHAPFAKATLARQSVQATLAGGVMVYRQYGTHAPFYEVVEWYQGKDSLMPVLKSVQFGCFSQSFRAQPTVILSSVFGVATEEVTICATASGSSGFDMAHAG